MLSCTCWAVMPVVSVVFRRVWDPLQIWDVRVYLLKCGIFVVRSVRRVSIYEYVWSAVRVSMMSSNIDDGYIARQRFGDIRC